MPPNSEVTKSKSSHRAARLAELSDVLSLEDLSRRDNRGS